MHSLLFCIQMTMFNLSLNELLNNMRIMTMLLKFRYTLYKNIISQTLHLLIFIFFVVSELAIKISAKKIKSNLLKVYIKTELFI